MGDWYKGEQRRFEIAWSPKKQERGYYTLTNFSQVRRPQILRDMLIRETDPVIIMECDGKKQGNNHEYFTFHVVATYDYETLPEQYKDRRGEYPMRYEPCYEEWTNGDFYFSGYPYLRPGAAEALTEKWNRQGKFVQGPNFKPGFGVPAWLLPGECDIVG